MITNFTATNEGELSLRKGDVVQNVFLARAEWARGELAGRMGIFPLHCVDFAV